MGCSRSRVGPLPVKLRGKGKISLAAKSGGSASTEMTWRRMIRFRTVKVTPAKPHLGGGDNPEYEDKLTIRVNVRPKCGLESFLYPASKTTNGVLQSTADARKAGSKHPTALCKIQLSHTQADILRELRASGILNGQASASGAIAFTVTDPKDDEQTLLSPRRRLPARLARLDQNPPKNADEVKKKLEAAEERRKIKQAALQERLRAHSRRGLQHNETAAQAERALQQTVADRIIEKELAFNRRVETLKAARRERVRAMSRKGDHAREVVEILDKECKKRAADTVAKKQNIVKTNLQRQERLRANRARLNQKHRENVWRAVARRLADQEEQAEIEENYEIETAKDSGDEGDFEPGQQWIM